MALFIWYRYEFWLALILIIVGLLVPAFSIPGARIFRKIARRRWLSVGLVGLIAACGCIGLTIARGIPVPVVHDEFAYLLQADTFTHGRLTNPTHPSSDFFETMHVLQHPTYASKYPPGQAMFLAVGQVLTSRPIVGVWFSYVAACCAMCWMLQAWLPPRWALFGAWLFTLQILLAPQFVPTINNWAHSYWGGAVAMLGGGLLFGAGRRLFQRPDPAQAIIFGVGLVVLANSRPLEGLVTCLPMVGLLVWRYLVGRIAGIRQVITQVISPLLIVTIPAFAWMGYYNQQVAGNWRTFPYSLHLNQYMATPVFIWQSARQPPKYCDPMLEKFYVEWDREEWKVLHTWPGWVLMTWERLRLLRQCFVGWLLFAPLMCGVFYWRFWNRFATVTCLMLLLISLQITWLLPHYMASIACLLAFLIAGGARRLWYLRVFGAQRFRNLVPTLAGIYFLLSISSVLPVGQFAKKNTGARWRMQLIEQLRATGNQHLIIVRYSARHDVHGEWVYNEADFDSAAVIWAREPSGDRLPELLTHFADRKIWLLEADQRPLKLQPFSSSPLDDNNAL